MRVLLPRVLTVAVQSAASSRRTPQTRGRARRLAGGSTTLLVACLLTLPVSSSASTVPMSAPSTGVPGLSFVTESGSGEVAPQVVAGLEHTCALLSDGTVRCWGANGYGQLGDGTTQRRLNPVVVLASGTADDDDRVVLRDVVQVSAGEDHTCALLQGGTVRCWGANSEGQLGDGSAQDHLNPVTVVLTDVVQVSAGGFHTCALIQGGTVRCWGANWGDGQLGDGTDVSRLSPVTVLESGTAADADRVALTDVVQVSAGGYHTCALIQGGTVRCWGANWGDGQLGDGTDVSRLSPVTVLESGTAADADRVALTDVVQVSAGWYHTCALIQGGTVRCWGANWGDGQLGDGSAQDRLNPVTVLESGTAADADRVALTDVVQVSAGWYHTCALLQGGTVRCWGANWGDGQLGDGSAQDRLNPVTVLESGTAADADRVVLTNVVQVAAGEEHTCALLGDSTVRCWGANAGDGQLGDGSAQDRLNPVTVFQSGTAADADRVVLTGVVQVAAGGEHTCGLLQGGTVRCWGSSWSGQLGDGHAMDRSNPVQVFATGSIPSEPAPIMLPEVTQISLGHSHTCALMVDGTVRCWGSNDAGQLGDGTTVNRANAVGVLTSGSTQGTAELSGVTRISAGAHHTCALLSDSTVRCWGSNSSGQLGAGTISNRANPVQVGVLEGVTEIAAGSGHTCALLVDTTMRCWGSNRVGGLGDGTTTSTSHPVEVLATGSAQGVDRLDRVAGISAGFEHTCAVLIDTTVRCWGSNFGPGQLGDGTNDARSNPVAVLAFGTADAGPAALSTVTDVSAGLVHTCALFPDGAARCWGGNSSGQLGDGTTTPRRNPVGVLVSGTADPGSEPVALSGVLQLSSGHEHTCARMVDSTVRCWGSNGLGWLGDGTTTNRARPVQVLMAGSVQGMDVLSGVTAVAAGGTHTCALLERSVHCWGQNSFGQLGDGTSLNRSNPVRVLASGFDGSATPAVALVLGETSSSSDPTASIGPARAQLTVTCSVLQVGIIVTCTVAGGDAGIDILWRAAYNPVIAEAGVTLDASGAGTFRFVVPAAALGEVLTVELVDWAAPMSLGVAGGPVPTSVPSGDGPVRVLPALLLALAGGLVVQHARHGSRPVELQSR